MDFIKPNDIVSAIRKYRTGGSLVTNLLNNIQIADIDTLDEAINDDVSILNDGNWFKLFPDKMLGDIKIGTDRYGSQIEYLEGDISVLEKISVNIDFAQFRRSQGIGVTFINKTPDELINQPAIKEFVEQVIETSNNEIGQKAVNKTKKKKSEISVAVEVGEIQSYKKIYRRLNPNISDEELKCYIWYKDSIGQTLSEEWYMLANYGEDTRTKSQRINDWINQGILFYFDGQLLPLPVYASGNIYEKVNRVVKVGDNSGYDIEHIVNTYGENVLAKQLEVLNIAYNKVISKKLIISGGLDANSLILKPISRFAKEFMISSTESMEEFKWWASGKKGTKGKVDYYKTDGREYQKQVYDALSLTDAFCLWLTNNRFSLQINGNITAEDIIYFYIEQRTKQAPDYYEGEQLKAWKAQLERVKSKAAEEGDRLFNFFLANELNINQKVTIEIAWNSSFNNYLAPDYSKIPIAFNICKKFYDEYPFVVKPEKREAVSFLFNEGSGCLAYDVGVGKTISAIMAIEQFIVAGYSKRPFIVVPNQTYKQWLNEIKNALPHRKVNPLFNLGVNIIDGLLSDDGSVKMIEEGTISVMTYEGFEKIGFNEKTSSEMLTELYEILNQGGASEMSDKKRGSFLEKLEQLIGRGLRGTLLEIESLGLDMVCFDEAHALKKVFTSVKGEAEEGKKKAKNPYKIQSGVPSNTALKGFMIANYIYRNNNYRNVILLTATPFTNSPLEVFSMLALVAYHQLEKLGIKNITDFFDNFIEMRTELTINHKLKPQYKQVVKGFSNLPSLQRIIYRYFNYKTGEDVGVIRPNKIVLPLVNKLVDGQIVDLPENEKVTCNIELNDIQKQFMSEIVAYAEGKANLSYGSNADENEFYGDESDLDDSEAVEIDENNLNEEEKAGVKALKAMNYSRNLALSPYLYEFSGMKNPTYAQYVNTSPKLKYVMECIKSVKKYHEDKNEPISGQVIYMDRGLEYFNLLKEYLIYELGFKKHEVGQITSSMSTDKKRIVQDAFLGRKYNEKTLQYENLDDSERLKVLLGSSSIKEGINLQKKATVLYNCFVDWNPTDMIQLQGRIWRQQNEFMNVRIVNPLMIDSMDIFMFQKLEEKTARLNTIWSNDGNSVLKLEEINPEEIKFALIKDENVIASLESEQKQVRIQDDVNALKVINERVEKYEDNLDTLDRYKEELDKFVNKHNPSKNSFDTMQKINYVINFYKQEYPKDDEGRIMIGNYDNPNMVLKNMPEGTIVSPIRKDYRPYWVSWLAEAKRLIDKENKGLLEPRNIKPENIRDYKLSNEDKIKELELNLENIQSEGYISSRAEQIREERLKKNFVIKPIPALVEEFKTLNYLLSIKRPKQQPSKSQTNLSIREKIDYLINLL